MKAIRRTSQFKRDVKRAKKRGKDLQKLKTVIEKLVVGEPLEAQYRDHALVGLWRGTRDCHLEPDWLLLYQTSDGEIVLVRTGTHADLFRTAECAAPDGSQGIAGEKRWLSGMTSPHSSARQRLRA